jgi:ribosome-binding factor A
MTGVYRRDALEDVAHTNRAQETTRREAMRLSVADSTPSLTFSVDDADDGLH